LGLKLSYKDNCTYHPIALLKQPEAANSKNVKAGLKINKAHYMAFAILLCG